MDSGIYNLIILLLKDKTITIGKLGKFRFPKRYYIYTGSARKNLPSRIERHKRKNNKKLRWHIDYLLNCKYAEVKNVLIYDYGKFCECSLNRKIMRKKGSEIIVKGFGSSDCKNKCPAHLVYFKEITN